MIVRSQARPRIFYGWIVVAIAFVTMGLSISARSSFSLLFPEILDEFGWDRGLTAGAFSVGFVASTAMLPIIGLLMDRYGPRLLIPIGALLVSGGLVLLTRIETPLGLYATMGLLIVNGSMAMSYIVHSMFLPNWFVRNRGLAVGLAFSGVGVLGIVLLPAMQQVIDSHGWRTACLAVAALIVVTIIPLNVLFQRGDPELMGLEPDGGPGTDGEGLARSRPDPVVDRHWVETEWTIGKAVATARFWWIVSGFFCGLFVWYGLQAHQTKFLIEAGFDTTLAASALGLVAFFGIAGQIGIGAFSDRAGREVAWTVALLGFAVSSALLIVLDSNPSPVLLYAMVASQGLLGNGLSTLFGAIITESFAGRRLASIFAMVSLGGNLGAGAGAWFLGASYDSFGSYVPAFWICIAASIVSIACMWMAAPRHVRLVAGQAEKRARRGDHR